MRGERRGVTLLELMLALTIVGFVLAYVAGLVDSLRVVAVRISASSQELTTKSSGERLLIDLLARLDVQDGTAMFSGRPTSASFASWCERIDGHLAPCMVRLDIAAAGEHDTLVMRAGSVRIEPFGDRRRMSLVYLGVDGSSRVWRPAWVTEATPPIALGVVAGTDTIVVPIGQAE